VLLSVHTRTAELPRLIEAFAPVAVCITDPKAAAEFSHGEGVRLFCGPDALAQAFADVDFDLLVNGIVGAAGLRPSYLALQQGRRVATANKESLVIAGALLTELAHRQQVDILPIDSEHSAIWQCLRAGGTHEVERIWLTGSGGPFRTRPLDTFADITPAEALGHPTWHMGAKITIDSATMMNKGFEIIEARWLFDLAPEQIEVVIHPESIVHSAVGFRDGSVIAQMGQPDMRHPIQYALLHPDRLAPAPTRLDLRELGTLHFAPPDAVRFPALRLAREALAAGGVYPIALNAANEVAVDAFLNGATTFPRITECVAAQLDSIREEPLSELDDIYEVDTQVRRASELWIQGHTDAAAKPAGSRS
jgi:1-deoxy-D-xylulose-5-phosphate reductoisomerase